MFRDLVGREPIVRAVVEVGGEALGQAVRRAVAAHAIHYIETFLPPGQHFLDQFGRVLHVDVERDDGLAAGIIQSGGKGGFLAEIPRK
jgi:hypothetical protein